MNLLFDLIYFEKELHGGISRMWNEYFKLLSKSELNITFLTKNNIDNSTQNYLRNKNYYQYPIIEEKSYTNKLITRLSQLGFYRNLKLLKLIPNNIKIFHSTDYINPIIKSKKLKIITTIHDMVFWDQKDKMKKNIWYWDKVFSIYHSLIISDKIITVSNASKETIINRFPWSEKKINVIHHGLAKFFIDVKLIPKKEKYFIFIGGRNEYKNYSLLLSAFSLFIKIHPKWKLHVIGENKHTRLQEIQTYKKLMIDKHVIDHGFIVDNSLVKLLQNASALIIPSLNEGFNFPLLEGMACGCPVLSSNIPVSKEIGKNYVNYFNNDKDELLDLMVEITRGSDDLKKISDAQKYAQTFTWENSFKKLVNVYQTCID